MNRGGQIDWLIANHQGSITATIAAGTQTVNRNRYLPYGALRASDTITTDRGFLNQTEDATTNLIHLNNRYHDPTLGRFISVDPIVSLTREPYSYGGNNPIRYSDPSGLEKGANGEEDSCAARGDCGSGGVDSGGETHRAGHNPNPADPRRNRSGPSFRGQGACYAAMFAPLPSAGYAGFGPGTKEPVSLSGWNGDTRESKGDFWWDTVRGGTVIFGEAAEIQRIIKREVLGTMTTATWTSSWTPTCRSVTRVRW